MFIDRAVLLAVPEVARGKSVQQVVEELHSRLTDPRQQPTLAYLRLLNGEETSNLLRGHRESSSGIVALHEAECKVISSTLGVLPMMIYNEDSKRNFGFPDSLSRVRLGLRAFVEKYLPRQFASGLDVSHMYSTWRDCILAWCVFCLEELPKEVGFGFLCDQYERFFGQMHKVPGVLWESCMIWSCHDSQQSFRCTSWSFSKPPAVQGTSVRAMRVRRAMLHDDHYGDLEVYALYRRKNLIDAVAKVLFLNTAPTVDDLMEVPDYHGVQLLCKSDADMDWLLLQRSIMRLFPRTRATERLFADLRHKKDARGGLRPNAASRGFPGVSFKEKPPVAWIGEEYQVMTVENFLNAEYSTEDNTHELYKLGKHFDHTLPWLFPQEVFGVDWESARVRAACEHYVRSRLQQ